MPVDVTQIPLVTAGMPPVVTVRSAGRRSALYRKQVLGPDAQARAGDLVRIQTESGEHVGFGLWNPSATIAIRIISRASDPPDETWWLNLLDRAASLRAAWLRLPESTNAWRVLHGEADGLPGVVIDRYADVLVMEAFTLAAWKRGAALLEACGARLGIPHWLLRPGPRTQEQEGFQAPTMASERCPREAIVNEAGTEFVVDLADGHKTGFFCDQRSNRLQLASLVSGRSMLDLCCYTGGFAVQAKRAGRAGEVTGVDLDEAAIALARRNAGRNQAKIRFVHADAFAYLRDMIRNGQTYDVVVLDPPKLIQGRALLREGLRKYYDLNQMAAQVVADGGLLLTCSCSGLLPLEEFRRTVFSALPEACHAQLLQITGAAADHPVSRRDPETEYLKALWLRLQRTETVPGKHSR